MDIALIVAALAISQHQSPLDPVLAGGGDAGALLVLGVLAVRLRHRSVVL